MPIDLHKELTELRRAILTMGSVVEQRVEQVLDALFRGDLELARSVRGGDREIDEMDVDIEAECLRVLALSQPVAADLRFVLAVLRINSELERIGDQAKSIAKRVIDLGQTRPVEVPGTLLEMAQASRQMLNNACDYLPTRTAHLLDLRGPAINVQTACSTSLVAVALACRAIVSEDCEMALAGDSMMKISDF